MSVTAGTRLGSYEIVAQIGAGGMGEVYRAHDIRLGRDVALKILPDALATDPDRVARFKREAKVLASLNHPHIAGLHGMEESGERHFLVMELVEGPTLADRIAKAPIPVDEALEIARQIAEGLAGAHEHNIIHRDLKPANIKVRSDGMVKLLDFGLAKAIRDDVVAADASVSPTLSVAPATRAGALLGTAAYMSPEQARGKAADKRSDIWAFGCVLFEMLAGRRVFDGKNGADVLVEVLEREPPWTALPPMPSQAIRTVLKGCLEKDRRKRIADVSTVLFLFQNDADLTSMREAQSQGALTAIRRLSGQSRRRHAATLGAGGLLIGTVAAVGVWMATRSISTPITRLAISTSGTAALSVDGNDRDLVITPDGTRVVYHSTNQILVRALDRLQPIVISGSGSPRSIFVSPDGQWVGFVDGAGSSPLKKVAITGGPAVALATTDGASRGATWGEDGSIVYATSASTGLQRVSSAGGAVTVLTRPDGGRGEADHLWPEFLPGGRRILFTITASTGGLDNAQIAVFDLGTGTSTALLRGGHHAHYVSTGHLVYGAGGTLRAVSFNLRRMEVSGPSALILDGVMTTGAGGVDATVASTGTLLYAPGRGRIGALRSLVWVDRTGRETPIAAESRVYENPRISPDGAHVALDVRDQEQGIWVWDIARDSFARLTSDRSVYPVWTPDSRRVLYAAARGGSGGIYSQAADGSGTAEGLPDSTGVPYGISPDGSLLVVRQGGDLLVLPLAPGGGVSRTGRARPLFQTKFSELNAEFAPDGRWIAYQSDESGRDEIYVRPFPDVGGGRWQVSTGGGRTPAWARNGRELFYRSADKAVMAVQVEPGSAWRSGPPTQMLPARYFDNSGTTGRSFDVTADGQRFLMIKEGGGDDTSPPQAIVVQSWTEELKRLVPVR